MSEFTNWLKKAVFQQIRNTIDENIKEIFLDAFLQCSKSITSNSFYTEANEDYIKYYINKITKQLHIKLIEHLKSEDSYFYIDSRQCPIHIQPKNHFCPSLYKGIKYINKSLLDTAKQRHLFQSLSQF